MPPIRSITDAMNEIAKQDARIAALEAEQKRAQAAFSELDAFLDDCDFPKSSIFRLNQLIRAVYNDLPVRGEAER